MLRFRNAGVPPSGGILACVVALGLAAAGGCVSKGQLTTLETQNRVLSEQNRAQLTEIVNLNELARNKETQLARAERELALLQEQADLDQKRLANYRREANEVRDPPKGQAR